MIQGIFPYLSCHETRSLRTVVVYNTSTGTIRLVLVHSRPGYLAGGLLRVGVYAFPIRTFLLLCSYGVHNSRERDVIGQYDIYVKTAVIQKFFGRFIDMLYNIVLLGFLLVFSIDTFWVIRAEMQMENISYALVQLYNVVSVCSRPFGNTKTPKCMSRKPQHLVGCLDITVHSVRKSETNAQWIWLILGADISQGMT